MNGESYVEWKCPHCYKITDIYIEIESQSDYYPDTNCQWCGEKIDDYRLDQKIMDEVTDYLVGQSEYSKE